MAAVSFCTRVSTRHDKTNSTRNARFEDRQTSGFINEAKIAPHNGKCNYFNTGNNTVQSQGRQEGLGRGGICSTKVGRPSVQIRCMRA